MQVKIFCQKEQPPPSVRDMLTPPQPPSHLNFCHQPVHPIITLTFPPSRVTRAQQTSVIALHRHGRVNNKQGHCPQAQVQLAPRCKRSPGPGVCVCVLECA